MKEIFNKNIFSIFENLKHEIYIVNSNLELLFFNHVCLENLGYTSEELQKITFDKVSKNVNSISLSDNHSFFDTYTCKNGDFHYVKSSISSYQLNNEKIYIISSIISNDEYHLIQEVREMNEIIMDSQSIGNFGSWTWDLATNEIIWTDEVYNIFGEDKETFTPDFNTFLEYLTQEDIDNVNEQVDSIFNDNKKYYQVKYDIHLKDGTIKHVQETGKIYTDEYGNKKKMVGTVFDITNSVKNEKELAKINSFLENIINTIKEEIIVFDEYMNIILSNQISQSNFDETSAKYQKRLEICNKIFVENEELQDKYIIKEETDSGFKYVSLTYQKILNEKGKVTSVVEISHDITNLMNTQKELENKANYDNLTKLANRNLFNFTLTDYINNSSIDGSNVVLFFIDLDNFKAINDTLGHDIGDDVLIKLSNILKDALNEFNVNGIPARLGGDEFTIILNNASLDDIKNVASYINKHTDIPIVSNNITINISTSIGISIFPDFASNLDELLKQADIAMYKVKKNGKNNFVIFDNTMKEDM